MKMSKITLRIPRQKARNVPRIYTGTDAHKDRRRDLLEEARRGDEEQYQEFNEEDWND